MECASKCKISWSRILDIYMKFEWLRKMLRMKRGAVLRQHCTPQLPLQHVDRGDPDRESGGSARECSQSRGPQFSHGYSYVCTTVTIFAQFLAKHNILCKTLICYMLCLVISARKNFNFYSQNWGILVSSNKRIEDMDMESTHNTSLGSTWRE